MGKTVVIGARGSHLARAMVKELIDPLQAAHPGVTFKYTTIMTTGDVDRKSTLGDLTANQPGAFSTEIERALTAGEIDIAMHSLKDLATAMPEGLRLSAVPLRADPLDALCGSTLEALAKGARVGTGSPRRIAQIKALRPDLELVPIRGNVPPRLRKMRESGLDAVILAAAGLRRLGMADEITELLDPDVFPPAPGQGVLGVQIRDTDAEVHELLSVIHDEQTAAAVHAERSLLAALHGGCSVPIGAYARITDAGELRLIAQVTTLDGADMVRLERSCALAEAAHLGLQTANDLLTNGAEHILSAVRKVATEHS
jgi:hydroxymethylbilane synthase